MFRALHGSTVLYPADGHATIKLVTTMCDLPGISYLRTTREATPLVYEADEDFPVGGSKTVRASDADTVTLIGAGVTLHACMQAADALADEGIAARVIDAYSVKPIDAATLRRAFDETGILIVSEDHRVEGGLGDAVLSALAATGPMNGSVIGLGVTEMPGSGTAEQMRAWAGIDGTSIAARARDAIAVR